MPDSPDDQIDWFRPVVGDVFGGFGRTLTVGVRVRVRVRAVDIQSVVGGPYCVEAGASFRPGPEAGLTEDAAGQVNC